jgi:hypothetical protein
LQLQVKLLIKHNFGIRVLPDTLHGGCQKNEGGYYSVSCR